MIFKTFAYREELARRAEQPDVYTYDKIPYQLRHQICVAICDGIGRYLSYGPYALDRVPDGNDACYKIDRHCRKEIISYLNYISEPIYQLDFVHSTWK